MSILRNRAERREAARHLWIMADPLSFAWR